MGGVLIDWMITVCEIYIMVADSQRSKHNSHQIKRVWSQIIQLLYIQCNSTDPITHVICYFSLHILFGMTYHSVLKLFTAVRVWKNAFVCFHHILNWPIRIKFLRPMSGHLVWHLLKAWSWRTVKSNTILQCILLGEVGTKVRFRGNFQINLKVEKKWHGKKFAFFNQKRISAP